LRKQVHFALVDFWNWKENQYGGCTKFISLYVTTKKRITQIKVWYVRNHGYKQILHEIVVPVDNYTYDDGQKF